jgi:hypothetical protein
MTVHHHLAGITMRPAATTAFLHGQDPYRTLSEGY